MHLTYKGHAQKNKGRVTPQWRPIKIKIIVNQRYTSYSIPNTKKLRSFPNAITTMEKGMTDRVVMEIILN
jgi:hypothetical protein